MTAPKTKIAVLGGGSWGTAVAYLLANKGHEVVLWVRRAELASTMARTRVNPAYLPAISLPEQVHITADFADICDANVLVGVVPSFAMRDLLANLTSLESINLETASWVNLTKGIEYHSATKSLITMSDLVRQKLGFENVLSLSGPSFALEVAAGSPTTVVLAGSSHKIAAKHQAIFSTDRFRVYTSDDLIGVELGGVFKNIIAIAAGISDGLGFGENAKGALISRGLVEMTRLGTQLGAQKETFFGLAGLGDMVISAMSNKSRNHQVGQRVGAGESLNEIVKSMEMVAEGVYAVRAIYHYALAHGLDLPITQGVYQVLYEDAEPLAKLSELMAREPKREEI